MLPTIVNCLFKITGLGSVADSLTFHYNKAQSETILFVVLFVAF